MTAAEIFAAIVGKSVVVHKASGDRWFCGNITEVPDTPTVEPTQPAEVKTIKVTIGLGYPKALSDAEVKEEEGKLTTAIAGGTSFTEDQVSSKITKNGAPARRLLVVDYTGTVEFSDPTDEQLTSATTTLQASLQSAVEGALSNVTVTVNEPEVTSTKDSKFSSTGGGDGDGSSGESDVEGAASSMIASKFLFFLSFCLFFL
jgi:hypothetical protein